MRTPSSLRFVVFLLFTLWNTSSSYSFSSLFSSGGEEDNASPPPSNQQPQAEERRRLTDIPKSESNVVEIDPAMGAVKPSIYCNEDPEWKAMEAAVTQLKGQVTKSEQGMQAMVEEKNMAIKDLKKKLDLARESFQETDCKPQLQEVQENCETRLSDLQQTTDASVEEVKDWCQSQVSDKQREHDMVMEETKQSFKITKMELEQKHQQYVESLQNRMEENQSSFDAKLAVKDGEIEKLQYQIDQLLNAQKKAAIKAQETQEELKYWRTLFASQTYCNMTMIRNDVYDASTVAYGKVIQAVKGERVQSTWKKVKSHVESGYNKVHVMYMEQHAKYWPQIEPHYMKHVNPKILQLKAFKKTAVDPQWRMLVANCQALKTEQIEPLLAKTKRFFQAQFDRLVVNFERECKHAVIFAKEKDMLKPYVPMMKQTCQEPEFCVTMILRAQLLLILLVFAGPILRLFFSILSLSLSLVLFVLLLPFRLVFGFPEKSSPRKSRRKPALKKPEHQRTPSPTKERKKKVRIVATTTSTSQ